ncbi:GntR family transcriptional regulator [Salinicoccus roseus]|uniref:GntR family transcriptional regulator n=1 Tax=Salinicoccus roseus TaxID=45670 RepID=UPI001CA6932E|nr:GntR family transcriptional regulator [Salinicoccus roseus]MBY8910120.1 GntR family transcriptional regulator [Salinicoccus roseus]
MSNLKMNSRNVKKSARDYALKQLKNAIIHGHLSPEQTLIETELAERLEISRTPLREALLQLETEHWVKRKSNGRLQVSAISVAEASELFKVRARLEEMVTGEATLKAEESDIEVLRSIAQQIMAAYEAKDLPTVLEKGAEFHTSIYRLSENRTVDEILSLLNERISRYRYLIPQENICSHIKEDDEHLDIVNHMAEKNVDRASQAMRNHIENSLHGVIQGIQAFEAEKKSIFDSRLNF